MDYPIPQNKIEAIEQYGPPLPGRHGVIVAP